VLAILAAGLCMASACVSSHEDGDFVDPQGTYFRGWAEHLDSTIEVTAFNRATGVWDSLGTTIPNETTTFAGRTMHGWGVEVDFSDQPTPWQCYFADPASPGNPATCPIPNFGTVQVRVHEHGGSGGGVMHVFEAGELDCTYWEVSAGGLDWWGAALGCGAERGVLELHVLN